MCIRSKLEAAADCADACVEPEPVVPCSDTAPPCGTDEVCISPGGAGGCYAVCF